MSQTESPMPKSPTSHLHVMNLVVALLAGVISITGGIYSLKNNLFSGPAYGTLQGIVRDQRIARPLKLASVEISDLSGAVVNTATTNDDGHYLIESLKTGNYVVKFTAPLHKIENKTIRVEKDLASSINVDLVPEIQSVSTVSLESPVARTITPPYTSPATYQTQAAGTPYQTATPAASGYGAAGMNSSSATVASTYAQSGASSGQVQDESSQGAPSGYHRRHSRRYSGDYDSSASANTTSTSSSSGSSLTTVGTQLLQALVSKKSDSSTSTTSN